MQRFGPKNARVGVDGVREGEACGRRWRDWDRDVSPFGSINVITQCGDEPLKTDNPRKVPVHPELARQLESWWDEGFELTYCRNPTFDDFIVPNAHARSRGEGAHTKSSAYKAMGRACVAVEVRFEGCHLTRHTMITWARRGGARADVLERVTHNAAGARVRSRKPARAAWILSVRCRTSRSASARSTK